MRGHPSRGNLVPLHSGWCLSSRFALCDTGITAEGSTLLVIPAQGAGMTTPGVVVTQGVMVKTGEDRLPFAIGAAYGTDKNY